MASCSPIPYEGDWTIKNATHEEIEILLIKGQTTKEQVKEKLSFPSSKESSSKSDEKWTYYYYGGIVPFVIFGPLIDNTEMYPKSCN